MFRVSGPHTPQDYYLLSITIDCYRFLFIANNCCRTLAGSRPYSWWAVWEFWFNGSMVQSICELQHCAVSGLFKQVLSCRACFSLSSNPHFVLFSCKICAEIVVHGMFALFLNGQEVLYGTFFSFLFFKISYSEYSFVTQIVISGTRIVNYMSERHVLYVYLTCE